MSRLRRDRSCRGKVRYRDKQQALLALRRIARGSGREKLPTRAYQCWRCKGWHLTSREEA